MTISSANASQQHIWQDGIDVDSTQAQGQELRDYSPVLQPDSSSAEPTFKHDASPRDQLQKIEQRKKTESDTWDTLQDRVEYAQGYVEGLVSLNDLRNQAASSLGIKNPLIESPHYQAGHKTGKEDFKEGLTYASGLVDGINPTTPIADALAETLDIKRQHTGKESTYWKGRSDGAAAGVMLYSFNF